MTCNCKTEIESTLTERFKQQTPEAKDHRVVLHGFGLGIQNNTMVLRGYMEAKAFALFPKKDGGTRAKTTTSMMVFSYCPFCGAKAEGGAA